MSDKDYINTCDRCGVKESFRVKFDYYLCESCMITLMSKAGK